MTCELCPENISGRCGDYTQYTTDYGNHCVWLEKELKKPHCVFGGWCYHNKGLVCQHDQRANCVKILFGRDFFTKTKTEP